MSGAQMNLRLGPATFTVSVAVTGGMLVMPDGTTGMVKPATAAAINVLGVALSDANPAGSNPTSPLNLGWAQPEVAVAYGPADVDVTYAASAAFGDLLIAAANGQVTPVPAPAATGTATATTQTDITDTRAIVGRCTEPGGVASAGVGRMRLLV